MLNTQMHHYVLFQRYQSIKYTVSLSLTLSLSPLNTYLCPFLSSSTPPACYPIVSHWIMYAGPPPPPFHPPKEQCWKGCGCLQLNTLIHWGLETGGSFHVLIFYKDPILLNSTGGENVKQFFVCLETLWIRKWAEFAGFFITFSNGLKVSECLS